MLGVCIRHWVSLVHARHGIGTAVHYLVNSMLMAIYKDTINFLFSCLDLTGFWHHSSFCSVVLTWLVFDTIHHRILVSSQCLFLCHPFPKGSHSYQSQIIRLQQFSLIWGYLSIYIYIIYMVISTNPVYITSLSPLTGKYWIVKCFKMTLNYENYLKFRSISKAEKKTKLSWPLNFWQYPVDLSHQGSSFVHSAFLHQSYS